MAKAQKGSNKGIGGSFKRLIGNRNTVTLLGILVCIVVLVVGYNYRVNTAINPTSIPYAKQSIPSKTLITSNMVGIVKISSSYLSEATTLMKESKEVIGKYSSYRTAIPEGSLFYKELVLTPEEMPDAAWSQIADGYTIYSLAVDAETTHENSIRAGQYIDLYMSAKDPNNEGRIIFGALIESIKVLQVKDGMGNNIVKNSLAHGTPAELQFEVSEDVFLLLQRAEHIKEGDIKITPLLRNENYTEMQGETRVSSAYLRSFIDYYTSSLN